VDEPRAQPAGQQVAALCTSKPHLDDDNELQPQSQSTLATDHAHSGITPKTSFVFLYLPCYFPLNQPFMSQVVINTHVNRYAKTHWTTKA
jgi:hypothetical protein